MECRKCGYALWNLQRSDCPECGTSFNIHDYRFKPGSVAFACHHCGHQHVGVTEDGMPFDAEAVLCTACGQLMELSKMPVIPLTDDTAGDLLPWEFRTKTGYLKTWWRTTCEVMFNPTLAAGKMHRVKSLRDAYLYSLIGSAAVNLSIFVTYLVLYALIMWGVYAVQIASHQGGGAQASSGPGSGTFIGIFAAIIGVQFVMHVVFVFLMPLMALVFTGLPAHLYLMIFEPERQPLANTLNATLYAQAPFVWAAIPVCGMIFGGYVAPIWMFVSLILILRSVHGTTGWHAALAVLWVPLLMVLLYFLMMFGMIFLPLIAGVS